MSDFDDLFKSRFEEHEVEVPDDMWSRIQDAQAPEDTRKPILLFWKVGVAAIILLSVASFSYLFLSNETKVTAGASIPVQSPSLSDKLQSNTNNLGKVLIATKESSVLESTPIKSRVKTPSVKKTAALKNNKKSKKNSTAGSSNVNNIALTNLAKNPLVENSKTETSVLSEISPALESFAHTEVNRGLIPTHELNLLNTPQIQQLNLLPNYDKKCPKFGNSVHGYFSVEAYHSSDYNLRSFSASDTEFESYISLREETESSRYSYSNGVKLKWHNKSGLGLGMGLERSVINETFSYTEQDAREVKVLISIDTLFNTDGTYTTSTDTTRVELLGVRTNRINNSYTSIDLPLNLSYQIEMGKWAIGVNGGIAINLLFDQKGRILNFDNKPAWISSGSENELDIYRSKSGLKFDGSISVVYHLTPSIDIMAEPYFRYNPNSFTRENHPLKQYYSTAGIRTGLRYNFGF